MMKVSNKSKSDTALSYYLKTQLAKFLFRIISPVLSSKHNYKKSLALNPLPFLSEEFADLPRANQAMFKLISDYKFDTVLDIGSGSGEHAEVFKNNGKNVTILDFGTSIYAKKTIDKDQHLNRIEVDFNQYKSETKYDCLWASHVLEHQPDPGKFIRKCIELTKEDGVICIIVPPLKHKIVGGHLTLWNAGLLLYQLVFNGLDCSEASICTHKSNISVIVKKKLRPHVDITYDNGDIKLLKPYFPSFVDEPFDGRILRWNW